MPTKEILIGLAGDLVPQSKFKDIASTRIGGPAAYPATCKLSDVESLKCDNCNAPLALMLSAYTPLSSQDVAQPIDNRYLYIYCCTAEGCKGHTGSWRAFRYQNTATTTSTTKTEKQPPSKAAPSSTPPPAATDTWGLSDTAAQTSDFSFTTSSNAFDFADLCSALDALPTSKPEYTTNIPSKQASKSSKSSNAALQTDTEHATTIIPQSSLTSPRLPSFYLHAQPESQVSKGNAPSKRGGNDEDDEDDDLIGGAIRGAPSSSSHNVNAAQHADGSGDVSEGETWDGEKYEADAVITTDGRSGPDAAYLKFARQLWRCPEQCARYGFNGQLLWPGNELPNPGVCASCGAPRVFEVQLMAPVIAMLDESADWLAEDTSNSKQAMDVQRPPSSWEWATAAVFTCSKSCEPSGEGHLVEELVAVANES